MELRHLRYFAAAAETLHFGRAAARINLAQPPLSQQIRQLERELGVALFHRSTRQVLLTEAGRHFLAETQLVLDQVEHAKHAVQRAHNGEVGRLMVAFLRSSSGLVMPNLLRDYRRRYPDVEIMLQETETSAEGLSALKADTVRGSVLRPPVNEADIDYAVIAQERLVVAVPAEHRLAQWRVLSLIDLAAEPMVAFRRHTGTALYDGIIAQCSRLGFSPRVVSEMSGVANITCLVAAGVGVAILPGSAAMLNTAGVAFVSLRGSGLSAYLAVAWRRNDSSPVLESFLQIATTGNKLVDRTATGKKRLRPKFGA